jgi:peroxiredoxin
MKKTMWVIAAASILLFSLSLVASCTGGIESPGNDILPGGDNSSKEGTGKGNLAYDFELQTLEGETVTLSGLRGQPVILNFWASWCPPCVGEMPYLQEIYEEWEGKGLKLLAVNLDSNAALARNFLEKEGLTLPVLLDNLQNVAERYNINGIPTTFFIDKDGIIREKVVGAFPNKASIERAIATIIP